MVDVPADDGFNNEVVGQRSLFNVGGGYRSHAHPQFFATGAGALFPFGDLHVHDHRFAGDPLTGTIWRRLRAAVLSRSLSQTSLRLMACENWPESLEATSPKTLKVRAFAFIPSFVGGLV